MLVQETNQPKNSNRNCLLLQGILKKVFTGIILFDL